MIAIYITLSLILVYALIHRIKPLQWLYSAKSAVYTTLIFLLAAIILGLVNDSDSFKSSLFFRIPLLIFLSALGLKLIDYIFKFCQNFKSSIVNLKLTSIILFHLGCYIYVLSLISTSFSIERLTLRANKGHVEWNALNKKTLDLKELPFAIELNKFTVEKYDLSDVPKDFKAEITLYITEKEEGIVKKEVRKEVLILNNPIEIKNYNIYLSSYDKYNTDNPQYIVIEIVKDNLKSLTDIGIYTMIFSIILMLFSMKKRRKK